MKHKYAMLNLRYTICHARYHDDNILEKFMCMRDF
jgi:hypothetical protein